MKHDTAGDPMTGLKWTRRTTRRIAEELATLGIQVSKNTVGRLLQQIDYSLRVNRKQIASTKSPDRQQQFLYLGQLRQQFSRQAQPIISVDTKKKELLGRFKNSGVKWDRQPLSVNDHDFRSDAAGIAIPYGIYDLQTNRGAVFVGSSHETSEFAVECIEKWWRWEGSKSYPQAKRLLILADSGGSNGPRRRAWKTAIQQKLCNRHSLSVTVSHYPPGASKWNPIEHRLFSEISKNWAAEPLSSYEKILNFIRTTTTAGGLRVRAYLVRKSYATGTKVSQQAIRQLAMTKHDTLPAWNYTLHPVKNAK